MPGDVGDVEGADVRVASTVRPTLVEDSLAAAIERAGYGVLRAFLAALVLGAVVQVAGFTGPSRLEPLALALVGTVAIWRIAPTTRLLRRRGVMVAIASAAVAVGALQPNIPTNGVVEIAAVAGAAVVASASVLIACLAICLFGVVLDPLIAGHSLPAVLGSDRFVNDTVSLALNGAGAYSLVVILRRTLIQAPDSLAGVRAGAPAMTAQLAAAVRAVALAALPRADPRDLVALLSPAEQRVVRLLAYGMAPKQAARELGVALPTVRAQIAGAKRKTGARSIEQLVGLLAAAEVSS